MDNKFTKKRVSNMLSYDWGRMLLLVVAICFVWSLAFTIGAPRASTGQIFGLMIRGEFSTHAKTSGELLFDAKAHNAFSYEILDFTSRDIDKNYYGQIMMSVTAVQEGDVMITSDSKDEIEKNQSAYRGFVDGYGDVVYSFDDLIKEAKDYCIDNGFISVTAQNKPVLNEDVIKNYFAKRMEKDPRFRNKKSEKYKQGQIDEIARIVSVWNNAIILENCLENHPELRRNYARFKQGIAVSPDDFKDEIYHNQEEKTYGIDIGKLSGGEKKIQDLFAFSNYNDKGEVTEVYTEGVILSVFNYKNFQYDLQFECLGFINYLIGEYSNFIDGELDGIIV